MAKSEKILAYVSTLKKFESALEIFGSDYYDNSVVFIEDTQLIYTHGTYFSGGGINWLELHNGILEKGTEKFKIWYCTQSEFESYSDITPNILSIVNYIVTAGVGALGMTPGETAIGTRLWKGSDLLRLIMDEMLLENEIILDSENKIYPDTFPGVIKQLFKLLKGYVPPIEPDTECGCYWGELESGEIVPDGKCNCTWGELESGVVPDGDDCCIWNELDNELLNNIYWGDVDIQDSSYATDGYDTTWGNINNTNSATGSGSSWNELLFRLRNHR